ncbi:flagellin FliC [Rhizobacter sp. J219]|jgi:flagellin|uniref:flagellin N-terminal helical domain-containing protein n=1 Tax=Rhizobacter sp. J219 TaxID=2898430 RepID=UPI002151CE62|nr:flagellin [Rhizobacter sp. J219]MCR5885969.1 flagellin FliC [Rhizobacter sp. J219]
MPQTINTNLNSLNAQRNLSTSQGSLSIAMQRLSSGLRVNSAKDDAAGLAIAERMNAQVRGMNVAARNANDGISLSQTAEGALGKIGDAMQRMRELSVQSANGTNNSQDRDNLQAEFQQLNDEVARIVAGTRFNGTVLFDGTSTTFNFQVGAGTDATDTLSINTVDLTATVAALGALNISGTDNTGALAAMTALDTGIMDVTTARATFGAAQNRFDSVIASLTVFAENLAAARGRIMDADFAAETAALSRAQILQQAGNAMVAQANQLPQQVLTLLQR